jgi:hypothetical protein
MSAWPTLPELQTRVLGALLPPGADVAAPAAQATIDAALGLLKRHTRGPSPAQRLQIYRHNLFESLAGALGAVFPVLAQLVGDEFFRSLARRFIAAHPPRAGNLHGFGRELPALLRTLPSAADYPYLADVAALEWAWHEVYHEADDPPLDPARLAEVPPEQQLSLGLQLVPAARLVESAYPMLRIWQAHQPDADPAAALSLDEGGVRLMVLRRGLEIEFVLLGEAETRWLAALADGLTLAEATIAAIGTDAGFDLAATLGRHLALGSFGALSFAALAIADGDAA